MRNSVFLLFTYSRHQRLRGRSTDTIIILSTLFKIILNQSAEISFIYIAHLIRRRVLTSLVVRSLWRRMCGVFGSLWYILCYNSICRRYSISYQVNYDQCTADRIWLLIVLWPRCVHVSFKGNLIITFVFPGLC